MRALIEKDPQSEGFFTSYSSSLERIALRKSRYLSETAASARPDTRNEIDDFDRASSQPNGAPSPIVNDRPATTPAAPLYPLPSTPPTPGRAPLIAQPNPKPAPAFGSSLFGSKLSQALNDERK
jgi:hypothetical protein